MTTALHPIQVTPPLPAGIHIGALVTYRGRKTSEHHSTFIVTCVDGGLLTLLDRAYPGVTTLNNVHPRVVTPVGVTVALCGCGHETGWSGRGTNYGYCEAYPCPCDRHGTVRNC